jgi:hypothetical protein
MATLLQQFVNHVDRRLQQEILNESLTLSKGGCKDHAEYREKCGRIRGIEAAIHVMRETMRSVELDEDKPDGGSE